MIQAVVEAVEEAIAENLLNGFFKHHEKGVLDVSLTEFNEAEFVANRLAEGRAEGRDEERINSAREFVTGIDNLIQNLKLSLEDACIAIGSSVQKYEEYKKLLQ